MKIFILYPNQLFKNISNFMNKKVLLIEEPLFFTQYDFHIQKLILHRASMKFYENYLKQKNILVEYFEDESYLKLYKDAIVGTPSKEYLWILSREKSMDKKTLNILLEKITNMGFDKTKLIYTIQE